MFNFLNDIIDRSALPMEQRVFVYKYINVGGNVIYVQGYKDILSFSEDEIVLKIKNGELKISGCNLNIKDLNINTITICGKIKSVLEIGGIHNE